MWMPEMFVLANLAVKLPSLCPSYDKRVGFDCNLTLCLVGRKRVRAAIFLFNLSTLVFHRVAEPFYPDHNNLRIIACRLYNSISSCICEAYQGSSVLFNSNGTDRSSRFD